MTSKEKAKELVNKYLGTGMMIRQAKQCALICVEEILSIVQFQDCQVTAVFWEEVEQEIEKL